MFTDGCNSDFAFVRRVYQSDGDVVQARTGRSCCPLA